MRPGQIGITTAVTINRHPTARPACEPKGVNFSMKVTTANPIMAGIFITPTERRISIRPQQQAMQNIPVIKAKSQVNESATAACKFSDQAKGSATTFQAYLLERRELIKSTNQEGRADKPD